MWKSKSSSGSSLTTRVWSGENLVVSHETWGGAEGIAMGLSAVTPVSISLIVFIT